MSKDGPTELPPFQMIGSQPIAHEDAKAIVQFARQRSLALRAELDKKTPGDVALGYVLRMLQETRYAYLLQ